MQEEIWKDIPGYEGLYKISSLSNVINKKGHTIKQFSCACKKGYLQVQLNKEGIGRSVKVHKLMAMSFLNHKFNGTNKIVVDHIDDNHLNNRLDNLQLLSNRRNCIKNPKGNTKFIGVSYDKTRNKYASRIRFNGKYLYLGRYNTPEEASDSYFNALSRIENGLPPLSQHRPVSVLRTDR